MNLCIDFLSSINIVDGIAKYTGGTNYVINLLRLLKQKQLNDVTYYIIVPFGFNHEQIKCDYLFSGDWCNFIYANSIIDCDFTNIDVVFFPQVNGRVLKKIKKIKSSYTHLKICATLHDRQHNISKYDWLDRYLYSGFRRSGIPDLIYFYLKKLCFDLTFGERICCIDFVFTDSNYSLQKLLHKNINNIKYYSPGNLFAQYEQDVHRGKYILFVSGGRPEKNMIRTLIAFNKYVYTYHTKLKMIITGVSDYQISNIYSCNLLRKEFLDQFVEFKGYVSYEELAYLYANCRYVVFPSKGEGYGLPIIEALSYGKTVLASRVTSIPEVAGCAVKYINPYDIESIISGFAFFENDANLERYESYIIERKKIIHSMVEQDINILIDDIKNIMR